MNERERHAIGLEARRAHLGEAYVEAAQARTTAFTKDFQDLITRYAWGEIWTRPDLDARSRRILVIGTLIALGHWEELELHARAALEQGDLSVSELREVVLQQAIYCGVPAANTAFRRLSSVLELAGTS